MNKMNSYIKSKIIILFLILGTVTGFFVVLSPKTAFAAPAGCYSKNMNGTVATTKSVACPTNEPSKDYSSGCWLRTVLGVTVNEPFVTVDCNSISIGVSDETPASTDTSGSDNANPLGKYKAVSVADKLLAAKNTKTCGSGEGNEVKVAFDFGCVGPDYCAGKPGTCALNPIVDIAFAIFRFLSAGVGLIVIGSIIVAGLQYTTSRGNPQATQASIKRISSSIVALLIFIFIFTIANFLVPGGMFIQ